MPSKPTSPVTLRATSFATYKDLRGYIKCLLSGKSETACYNYGDNGTGAWGANTAQTKTPLVAINKLLLRKIYGNSAAGNGQLVRIQLPKKGHGKPFEAAIGDLGPEGVIDLNPAALIAAGLDQEEELSTEALVTFL